MHRKLVHPNLSKLRNRNGTPHFEEPATESRPPRHGSRPPRPGGRKGPPVVTSAEEFYYLKQMNNETALVAVMDDGTRIRGRIEWYDRGCVKFIQESGPGLVLFKHSIRCFYKQEEE